MPEPGMSPDTRKAQSPLLFAGHVLHSWTPGQVQKEPSEAEALLAGMELLSFTSLPACEMFVSREEKMSKKFKEQLSPQTQSFGRSIVRGRGMHFDSPLAAASTRRDCSQIFAAASGDRENIQGLEGAVQNGADMCSFVRRRAAIGLGHRTCCATMAAW